METSMNFDSEFIFCFWIIDFKIIYCTKITRFTNVTVPYLIACTFFKFVSLYKM